MLAAANAKKKTNNKNKKGKDEPKEEEEVKQENINLKRNERKELDLTNPKEFAQALSERAPRPFTFGPLEFDGLNLTDEQLKFDDEKARQYVIDSLDDSMGEPHICIHGYLIEIRGRRFKRRTTMLKHGRFLQNLLVSPVYPKPIFQEEN